MLSEYNSMRARLLNSQELLEGTNMVLYNIEATLIRWCKDSIRRNEIKLLMQGPPLPRVESCTTDELPPAQQCPSSPPPPPVQLHVFPEPEDTVGQAQVRHSTIAAALAVVPPPSPGTSEPPVPTSVSWTTDWRRRKAAAKGSEPGKPGWKEYSCQVCKRPMSTPGHTQFRGQRYGNMHMSIFSSL